VPSYIKNEPKDGMTSELRQSNLSQEIRYFSLTLVFIYLVMVSFVVSRKAPIWYCTSRIMAQSPSSAMMGIYSSQMANALNYSLRQTHNILRKWMSSISLSYNDYIHMFT
jgi:1,4-dihydroxy-2-naphthoate octaprenyltransferase